MQKNERKMIHVSFDLVDEFEPRVPKQRADNEDGKIPRICAAPTIRNCLSAIPQAGEVMYWMNELELPIIIHAYYLRCNTVRKPSESEVEDCNTTGELWLLEKPSECHRIDYEITASDFIWYTDSLDHKQRYPLNIKLKRTYFQDNKANFIERYCCKNEKQKAIADTWFEGLSFRTLISNMGDKLTEISTRRTDENTI